MGNKKFTTKNKESNQPQEPKTIYMTKNFMSETIKTTEPTTQLRTFVDVQKERESMVETFERVNGVNSVNKLTETQSEYLEKHFDSKLRHMKAGDKCFNLLSMEVVNVGDTLLTSQFKQGERSVVKEGVGQVQEDIMVNHFTGFDGIVKYALETTPENVAKKSEAKYYFVVI